MTSHSLTCCRNLIFCVRNTLYTPAHMKTDSQPTFLFCLRTGLTCKYRNLLLSKSPFLPTGRQGGTVPSFTQIWLSFVFWAKLLWLFHSRYAFFFVCFFLPQFQFLYVASCLCVTEEAQAFVFVTVLNIEHKRKGDKQAKTSF